MRTLERIRPPAARSQAVDGDLAALDDVTVAYGGLRALDGVTLRVQAGERVAVVGASGAGKTTLLRAVSGLVLPSQGKARALGRPTSQLGRRSARRLRRRIGFVHQDLALVDSLRVVHNVNAGKLGCWPTARALWSLLRPRAGDDVRDALARVGIADKIWTPTAQLSGGQRQRVAIARTLVQGPDLVLADEPAANLDRARAREVVHLLVETASSPERALIVALHDVDLAVELCGRVVGLKKGRVAFDLPASEVGGSLLDDLYAIDEPTP